MKRLFSIPVLLIFFLFNCKAQNCSFCAETLRHGTSNVFYNEKRSKLDESASTMFAMTYSYWQDYSSSEHHTTGLDAAYSIYSLNFSNISNEADRKLKFENEQKAFQSTHTLSQDDYETVSRSLIDKTPYQAFQECIQTSCGNGISIDSKETGDFVVIFLTYQLQGGDPTQKAVMTSLPTVANAVAVDKKFYKGLTLSAPTTISSVYKKVNPKQDVVFSCSFQNFLTSPLTIRPLVNGNSKIPVGTIVASVLDYGIFCALNEIPVGTDLKEVTWVPADGRSVTGSTYAKVKQNVPDLRGTFLRGLNAFDPNTNQPFSNMAQKDPQDRTAGQFQPDEIKSHAHTVHDPGHAHGYYLNKPEGSGGPGASGSDGNRLARPDHTTEPAYTGITIESFGGTETRPGNIAVYYYIKIN